MRNASNFFFFVAIFKYFRVIEKPTTYSPPPTYDGYYRCSGCCSTISRQSQNRTSQRRISRCGGPLVTVDTFLKNERTTNTCCAIRRDAIKQHESIPRRLDIFQPVKNILYRFVISATEFEFMPERVTRWTPRSSDSAINRNYAKSRFFRQKTVTVVVLPNV